MPNPRIHRKVVQTRANKKATVEMDTLEDVADSATSSASLAPTALLRERRKSHEMEMLQMKVEWQSEKIDELTKERDYLKEQLASALNKDRKSLTKAPDEAINLSSNSSSDTSFAASSSSSHSSTDIDTSLDEVRKRRRKKKMMMKKKQMKKRKEKTYQRAQSPKNVLSRYKSILQLFRRGRNMATAFKHYGVDRNTVVITAPIAELSIVAPSKYKDLLKNYNHQVKLSVFAAQCAFAIKEDAAIEEKVKAYKASGQLLPFKMK